MSKKPPGIEKLEKEATPPVMTNTAVSMALKDGEYMLVEIPFNINTGETGPLVMKAVTRLESEAVEAFKIRVVELGIL